MKKAEVLNPKSKKKKRRTNGPKWQTGEYERFATFKFILPYPFLLLCKLLDITPMQAISDFLETFSCAKTNVRGQIISPEIIKCYVSELGYGNKYYSENDVSLLFQEMKSINQLWPKNAEMDLINKHAKWLKHYHKYWFKKWYYETRRSAIEI